jgi:sugar phosphate isomerase/epimerase
MGTIYPGLVSITFRKLNAKEIIDLLLKTDLRAIEWGGDVHVPHGDLETAKAVRERCSDAGIATPSYGSYYRLGGSRGEGLSFAAVADTARALDAQTIRIWAGNRGSDEVSEEERAALVDEARECCRRADAAGLTVSFEFHANTLTDTNESAVRFLAEIDHPAARSYWQPRNHQPVEYSLAGLKEISEYLTNAHVFHWIDSKHRFPLGDGKQAWSQYLAALRAVPGDRFAMLEFVRDDDEQQFLMDADTLVRWLE